VQWTVNMRDDGGVLGGMCVSGGSNPNSSRIWGMHSRVHTPPVSCAHDIGVHVHSPIQAHDAQLLLRLPQQPDLPCAVARVPVSAQYGNNAAAQLQLQPKIRWEQPVSSCRREHHAHASVWTLDGCQMQAQAAVDS
jgi:hypothetical protein